MNDADIHKAGGILLHDKKFLVTRTKGKPFFVSPGGKLEHNENSRECLIRELAEELNIMVGDSDLEDFGTFEALAAGEADTKIHMDVFIVKHWNGDIAPSSEIEEVLWIDSSTRNVEIGSIFQHDVLPLLKNAGMIH